MPWKNPKPLDSEGQKRWRELIKRAKTAKHRNRRCPTCGEFKRSCMCEHGSLFDRRDDD